MTEKTPSEDSPPKHDVRFVLKYGLSAAAAAAALVFVGGEVREYIRFVDSLETGAPYAYLSGNSAWLPLVFVGPFLLLAVTGRLVPADSNAPAPVTGKKQAVAWAAMIAGLAGFIFLIPFMLGGGTMIAEQVARRYGYEACYWRLNSAAIGQPGPHHLAWEAFYVPHGSSCLQLNGYEKEKFFSGIESQPELDARNRTEK